MIVLETMQRAKDHQNLVEPEPESNEIGGFPPPRFYSADDERREEI